MKICSHLYWNACRHTLTNTHHISNNKNNNDNNNKNNYRFVALLWETAENNRIMRTPTGQKYTLTIIAQCQITIQRRCIWNVGIILWPKSNSCRFQTNNTAPCIIMYNRSMGSEWKVDDNVGQNRKSWKEIWRNRWYTFIIKILCS